MAAVEGQWSTGLCDCFDDCSSCCVTCCCPCITFGQNAEIIDRGSTTCCFESCIFYLLSFGCACCYSCTFRSKLRGQFSLPADPCGDFCVHYCCLHCALCQEYRELKNRGLDPSIGWDANAEKMRLGDAANVVPPNVAPGMAR